MAKPDLGAIAERLFKDFMAPLVLGGSLIPGKPIGARAALALGNDAPPTAPLHGSGQALRPLGDPELVSYVQLARVRRARRLLPIDRFERITPAEWALGAALHDIVQSAHPALKGPFRGSAPGKLLRLAVAAIEQVAAPHTIEEALARHTWFARLFEITRTDTTISWWVGASTFLGEEPPERLTAWPELRRVKTVRTPRPLIELPAYGAVDPDGYGRAISVLLSRTPLTDIATCDRELPSFVWSAEVLGLVATRAGRTLALRAVAGDATEAVDGAVGRATRQLLTARAWKSAAISLDFLRERALSDAEGRVAKADEAPIATFGAVSSDASFARAAGAVAARRWIAMHGDCFREDERRRLLMLLEPAASGAHAKELAALMEPAFEAKPAA